MTDIATLGIPGRERGKPVRLTTRTGLAPCVLILVLLAVAACSRPDSHTADVRTITLFTSSLLENDPRSILVESFERAHPTIRVKAVPLPADTDVKRRMIKEAIEGGINAPDVYLGDVIWPAEFGAAGLAMPLDDVFGEEIWERFPDELVEASTYDGKKYAVPFYSDRGLLYYRRDKIGPEEVPRTWEELAERSRELQEREGFDFGYVWQGKSYEGLTCNWLEMVSSADGQLLDEAGGVVNSPESARALEYMLRLIEDGVTPPDVARFTEPDSTKFFATGRAAFMRGWNSAYPVIKKGLGPRTSEMVGVAPLPTFSGQPYPGKSAVGGWSLFVNPRTEKLDAVVELVEWFTDIPAQRTVAEHSEIPSNLSFHPGGELVDSNPVLKLVYGPAGGGGAPSPVHRPSTTPAYPEVSRAVYRNIHRALTGEVPSEQALADADREIDAILERLPDRDRPAASLP